MALVTSGIFLFLYSQTQLQTRTLQAAATATQIIIDPSNPAATELAVNEGNTLQLKPHVIDSAGNTIDNAPLVFSTLSTDIATVDAAGMIEGKKAGFSTLTVSSGGVVATTTLTVAKVTAGATGFEITGVAQDLARRLYLADTRDHTILRADDLEQAPSIYAGVNQKPGWVNDDRSKSLFNNPAFLAFNQAEGTLYVSDSTNNAVRLVRPGPSGKVETLAGTGQSGSADGSAGQAMFNNPQGIALDSRGNLWVVDSSNHTVRQINLVKKTVKTIAGKAGSAGFADGSGESARFNSPAGIAVESESLAQQLEREEFGLPPAPISVIVADTGNGVIRRVKETGQVETLARTSTKGMLASELRPSPTLPPSLALAPSSSFTSAPPLSHSPVSFPNAAPASFNAPTGVTADSLGNIYVTEPNSGQVKTLLPGGHVVQSAQTNTFIRPKGIVISRNGRVLVAESGHSGQQITYGEPEIAGISPDQISSKGGGTITLKGKNFAPGTVVVVAGVIISEITIRDTQTISFNVPALPSGLATLTVQNRGGLAQRPLLIRAVSLNELPYGYITTVAGGSTFSGDGSAANTVPILPVGITVDAAGNLLVVDSLKSGIRRINAASGIVTTVAGNGNTNSSGDGGLAIVASLSPPGTGSSNFVVGLAFDRGGNFFISDGGRIRRVDAATGIIATVAGGNYGFCGDGGDATRACFNNPNGIAVDADGNLFIADSFNHRIRKVDAATGIITTAAGSGPVGDGMGSFSGDGSAATSATLNSPVAVAVDSTGNLYIADFGNSRVRKVTAATGIITTVAGTGSFGTGKLGDNGPATAAEIVPLGVAVDAAGNLIVVDAGSTRIRRIDAATGIISTIAGNGELGSSGDGGPATSASFFNPNSVTVDAAGNVFVADTFNYRVRKIDAKTGVISTVAGNGMIRIADNNGPATAAALSYPAAVAFDLMGNLFIADRGNSLIRKVDLTGTITTVAGNLPLGFSGDNGPALAADLSTPNALVTDAAGNLFFADSSNQRIRKIDSKGIITTVAGNSQPSYVPGFAGDGDLATKALLAYPRGVTVDSAGNLYIADTENHRVRRVDAKTGIIATVAGSGPATPEPGGFSGDNGPGKSARLNSPYGVAVDRTGNLLIADSGNGRVRKLDSNGILTTIVGGGSGNFCDGAATASTIGLTSITGIITDAAGNIFLSDSNNHRILKVDAKGIVTTVAGNNCNAGFSGDSGLATLATFTYPRGIAFDPAGNLFIADTDNHRIRAVHFTGRTGRRRP